MSYSQIDQQVDVLRRLSANLSSTSLFPFATRHSHLPVLLNYWLFLNWSFSFFRQRSYLRPPILRLAPPVSSASPAIGLDPSASGVPARMTGRRSDHLWTVVRSVHALTRESGAVVIGRALRGACCLAMWRATRRLATATAAAAAAAPSSLAGGGAAPLHFSPRAGGCCYQSSSRARRLISPASVAVPKVNGAR